MTVKKQIQDDFDDTIAENKNSIPSVKPKLFLDQKHQKTSILKKYYRHPGIHVKLPSNGYFSEDGSINFTITGEIPVYPMTTADELILKNPDSLLSGHSIEKVISSCCPDIHDIRSLPTPDIDVILLAIRATSYGENIDMEVTCPNCEHVNNFNVDLREPLSDITHLAKEYPITLNDDMVVYIRPYTFDINTRAALASFEENKKVQLIENDKEIDDRERVKILTQSYENILALNAEFNAESILKIVVEEGEVTDFEEIKDFIKNTDKNTASKIDDAIKALNNIGMNKNKTVQCINCQHEWQTELTFDPARFFE